MVAKELMSHPTYYHLLAELHRRRQPATYLEIGVHEGHSLGLVAPTTKVVGIDPEPKIVGDLDDHISIVTATSDDYFASEAGQAPFGDAPIDMAFIDGMHHVEFALRDFINIEARSAPGSTVLIHDCMPIDETTASRERTTVIWSGDIWKLIPFLREHRPDLDVTVHDVEPTGLAEITNLDPSNTVLSDRYDDLVDALIATPWPEDQPST